MFSVLLSSSTNNHVVFSIQYDILNINRLLGKYQITSNQEAIQLNNENLSSIKKELSDFSNALSSYETESWRNFPSIDLYMDQVVTYLERLVNIFGEVGDTSKVITSSMVNNYVKEGYLKRPINKKYDKVHLVTLYIMSMLKPILPIPLIANSLGDFQNEQEYQNFFEDLTKLQDESFNKISNKLSAALEQINEDDYETALRLFALQLTSEANARRIAAEKILFTLNKREPSKPAKSTDKEKSK
jgi:hypothetical protein